MRSVFTTSLHCLLFLVLLMPSAVAQDLKTQLQGKEKLDDIMRVVDSYYAGKPDNWKGPTGDLPKIKHWKRWEWYMSGRLGENGHFVDVNKKLMEAQRDVERMPVPADRDINPFWTSEGPSAVDANGIGRADRIAFHPTDPDIFYVGTPAGGLWRTTNGGGFWQPLTDHIPSTGISGIVVSWQDPDDLYILTGDGDSDYFGGLVDDYDYERRSIGVLRSVDEGQTWFQAAPLDTVPFIALDMAQDPTDANKLIVATDLGIYYTDNRGGSWSRTRDGVFYDVEYKPGTQIAYASGQTEVVYSWTGGGTWAASGLDVGLSGVNRTAIAVTPANTSRVYLFVGDVDSAGVYDGTYVSNNSGLTYTQINTSPNILTNKSDGSDNDHQAGYDHCIAASSANSNIVVTGAVRIWRSTNGASSYSYLGGTHADIHDLSYNPLDDKLYASTDGGVYVSDDNGTNWTDLFFGFRTSQIYQLAGTLLDDDYLLAGYQDNGVKLKDGPGSSWDHVQGADGYSCSFYHNNKEKFYTTANRSAYRFWDNGAENKKISPAPDSTLPFFGNIAAHVSDSDYVFVGYHDVYRSSNQGDSWTNVGATGKWALKTCPSNSNRIYAAGPSQFQINGNTLALLYRSDNMGDDWVALHVNDDFPDPATVTRITDIAVDPINSNKVFVTIGGFDSGPKVLRSDNAGLVWTDITDGLPAMPVNCVAVLPSANHVYIGTDLGVFYRHTSMSDWMPFNNGLPNTPVSDLFINQLESRVYAATFGRGVWSTEIATDCPEDLVLSGFLSGDFYYQTNNEITTTANVDGGVGTEVFFKAGNRVVLQPGFVAERFTKFQAYVGPCGVGGIPD